MSKCYASKVISIAEKEVGYLEKASNSQLDDKTANAGRKNFTKYARDLDNISGFYNGKKNGYPWCDVYVDWCFVQAYGVEDAKRLLCQPSESSGAGCEYSAEYYKKNGQWFNDPEFGDQVFFKKYAHTGLVCKCDEKYVYAFEGNTSSASGVVENGGAVVMKRYKRNSSYIDGYGRPKYDVEKEILEIDGSWGRDTTLKSQQVFGTKQDGKISHQPNTYKEKLSGCKVSSWEFDDTRKGSQLIRTVQTFLKDLGFYTGKIDGLCEKKTVTAIQQFLASIGLYTGEINAKMEPETVSGWQMYINNRLQNE